MSTVTEPAFASTLRHIAPQAAQAARFMCDARHLDALRRLAGLDALEIAPLASAARPAAWSAVDAAAAASDGAHADADADAFAEPGRIVLAHLAGMLELHVDLAHYPALQIVAASAGDSARHSMRITLANALLAPLLQRFQAAGLGRWRVTSVERSSGAGGTEPRFQVALLQQRSVHRLVFSAPGATLELLRKRLAALPTRVATDTFAAASPLRIPGTLALGARHVPFAALQALRPGDVLLRTFAPAVAQALGAARAFSVPAAWGAPGGSLRRVHARVVLDGTQLTIETQPMMNDETLRADTPDPLPGEDKALHDSMFASADASGEFAADFPDGAADALSATDGAALADGPLDIGMLDLPVQFELDSVALPLAELAALRPGYVIELAAPVLDTPVRLVTHGQTVGFGEIVAIGEHLGVRITRMAYAGSTDD
ncbi:MAG TPA: type III secretion system cytoplasmic ring protein SctQ [Paraburkholderia sp.]|jgi:type III secretion protein Q|nr:type III secretion system cytoplasmic ring protein SctQ [Paraburkholderia sp.]